MRKITLEELLQKHFGLNGALELANKINTRAESRNWSAQGHKAYARMASFIYDLSAHVELMQDNEKLASEIEGLVDVFDKYEYED